MSAKSSLSVINIVASWYVLVYISLSLYTPYLPQLSLSASLDSSLGFRFEVLQRAKQVGGAQEGGGGVLGVASMDAISFTYTCKMLFALGLRINFHFMPTTTRAHNNNNNRRKGGRGRGTTTTCLLCIRLSSLFMRLSLSLSRADNAVIYSSLSIKNIIPNQKPIIPQASSDYAQALCVPLPLLLPLSLSLCLLISHTIKVAARLREGVAGRQHSDIVMVKVNIIFFFCVSVSPPFLPVVRWFLLQCKPWEQRTANWATCVCVCGCMFGVCLCVCCRWLWALTLADNCSDFHDFAFAFVVFDFWYAMTEGRGRERGGVSG